MFRVLILLISLIFLFACKVQAQTSDEGTASPGSAQGENLAAADENEDENEDEDEDDEEPDCD